MVPVSYTQLEVYKRQVLGIGRLLKEVVALDGRLVGHSDLDRLSADRVRLDGVRPDEGVENDIVVEGNVFVAGDIRYLAADIQEQVPLDRDVFYGGCCADVYKRQAVRRGLYAAG